MTRDTFDDAYECGACGREWDTISKMRNCPCDKYAEHWEAS